MNTPAENFRVAIYVQRAVAVCWTCGSIAAARQSATDYLALNPTASKARIRDIRSNQQIATVDRPIPLKPAKKP